MSLSKKVQLTVRGYSVVLSSKLEFYQNDQIKLIFEINEYGIDVANSTKTLNLMPINPLKAILFFETPEGIDFLESANIEDNAVTFYLSSKQTSNVGVSKMQIQLIDDDGCQITLPEFMFEIRENIIGNYTIIDTVIADGDKSLLTNDNFLIKVSSEIQKEEK